MRISRRLVYKHWNPVTYWKNRGWKYTVDETGCRCERMKDAFR